MPHCRAGRPTNAQTRKTAIALAMLRRSHRIPLSLRPHDRVDAEDGQRGTSHPREIVDRNDRTERDAMRRAWVVRPRRTWPSRLAIGAAERRSASAVACARLWRCCGLGQLFWVPRMLIALVAFWSGVFGYEVVPFPDSDDRFTILVPPDRAGTRIAVHRTQTPVQERPRVHLDLVVDSAQEQSSEVDRLVALGASRVAWDYSDNPDFVVLADPEGNRFCIVDANHG